MRIALLLGAPVLVGLAADQALTRLLPTGPVSQHMASHILAMNVLAPLAALLAIDAHPPLAALFASGRGLFMATTAQVGLLWLWHSPVSMSLSHSRPSIHLVMQLSLIGAALWFWLTTVTGVGGGTWRSLLALLISGKLFCLLGVLLVFAPRPLYPGLASAHPSHQASDLLADQHLAGLLMVIACPLSFVLAAVVIAARLVQEPSPDGAGPLAHPGSGDRNNSDRL